MMMNVIITINNNKIKMDSTIIFSNKRIAKNRSARHPSLSSQVFSNNNSSANKLAIKTITNCRVKILPSIEFNEANHHRRNYHHRQRITYRKVIINNNIPHLIIQLLQLQTTRQARDNP